MTVPSFPGVLRARITSFTGSHETDTVTVALDALTPPAGPEKPAAPPWTTGSGAPSGQPAPAGSDSPGIPSAAIHTVEAAGARWEVAWRPVAAGTAATGRAGAPDGAGLASRATTPDAGGGTPHTARAPSAAGTPSAAGAPHTARAPSAAGTPSAAGAPHAAAADVPSRAAPPPPADALFDGSLRFRLASGTAREVAVALEWTVTPWSPQVFVLIPAAAYSGNRYPVRAYRYPPMVHEPGDVGPDAPVLITDVPRLLVAPGDDSAIELLSGDAATPCICFHNAATGQAAILLTEQGSRLGNHGLAVVERSSRDGVILRIEAPGVRRGTLYKSCSTAIPSWDRGADWKEGEEVEIRFRIHLFEAREVQELYDRLLEVRTSLSGPPALIHGLPFSAAWRIVEEKYHRDNWCEEGYFRVGTHDAAAASRYQDWQTGWVGGGMVPFPMLLAGTPLSRERALANLRWMFTVAQHGSGLFHAVRNAGGTWDDGFDVPGTEGWYMVRKQADALYFLAKTFALLDSDARLPDPDAAWRAGTLRLADTLCATLDRYGQLGQYLHRDTADVVVGGSTAAAIAPAALALCGQVFGVPRYVEAAVKLARSLDERDVRSGVTTGGPGEILKCPDSESAFAMLESFVVLWEVTTDPSWVARAKAMAAQCATWCHSYDYRFPADSWFGRLDVRTAGSVWANVQNKHSAPGICTLSGDSLLKLFRATGEAVYLELIRETAHNLTQYLCREDRQVGDPSSMRPGWMCERVNTSDWEGRQNVGGSLFGSCWPEVSLMLTSVEIPGIYVQPDVGFTAVLDHVDLVSSAHHDGRFVLTVRNPTPFDAAVRVFSELSSQMARPLGQAAACGWPVVDVPAGARRELGFDTVSGALVESRERTERKER